MTSRKDKVSELLNKLSDRFAGPDFKQTDDFWHDWEILDKACAGYIKCGLPDWDAIGDISRHIYCSYITTK